MPEKDPHLSRYLRQLAATTVGGLLVAGGGIFLAANHTVETQQENASAAEILGHPVDRIELSAYALTIMGVGRVAANVAYAVGIARRS